MISVKQDVLQFYSTFCHYNFELFDGSSQVDEEYPHKDFLNIILLKKVT